MTEGVGAELVGGDREGRARAGPQGSEGARVTAIALAGRHHRSRGGFGNGAVHAAHQVPRFERRAEEHGEDWGHALCLVGR